MIAVAITGSFASGKSFMLDYLATKGFKTFSADELVKNLYNDYEIQTEVLKLLPTLPSFDKQKIAQIIYNDEAARKMLQNFIHPFVVEGIKSFKNTNISTEVIFAEIPLLFEANLEQYFDFMVVTFCSEESRLERAKNRKGFNQEIYNKIEQIQLPQSEKIKKANFVLNTDVNLIELEKQIIKLLEKLQ